MYVGNASISPQALVRQVFTAQLLPLGLGMLFRRMAPAVAARIEPPLKHAAGALLILLLVLVLIDIAEMLLATQSHVGLAIVLVTLLAIACGHALGGPDPGTRTAVGICAAARNPGLALLVATLNSAQPAVIATIFAYLVISALTLIPYVVYRRRHPGAVAGLDGSSKQ
jgi:predicted Na+-dependent transporter